MHVGGVLGLKRISFARSNWVEHGRKCGMKFMAVEMFWGRSCTRVGWGDGRRQNGTITDGRNHCSGMRREKPRARVLRAVCGWVLGYQRLLHGIGVAQGWWRMGGISNGQRGTAGVGVVRQNPSSWVNAWWWMRLIQRLPSPALVTSVGHRHEEDSGNGKTPPSTAYGAITGWSRSVNIRQISQNCIDLVKKYFEF